MEFSLTIHESQVGALGEITLVRPVGKVHSGTYLSFEQRLLEIIEGGRHKLVVDFGAVPFCSSAGIRALMKARKAAQARSGDLRIANLQEDVRQVFESAGLPQILALHDTVQDAIVSFP